MRLIRASSNINSRCTYTTKLETNSSSASKEETLKRPGTLATTATMAGAKKTSACRERNIWKGRSSAAPFAPFFASSGHEDLFFACDCRVARVESDEE